jgi:hypothetical protein
MMPGCCASDYLLGSVEEVRASDGKPPAVLSMYLGKESDPSTAD